MATGTADNADGQGRYVPGRQVRFDEGDGQHHDSLGVITRDWPNGRYVTVVSDGRTFVRLRERVTLCDCD